MFLAHKNSINDGEFIPLTQYGNKRILAKNSTEFMTSNICPHQGSIISTRQGSGHRTCPYHNWSFDLNGVPLTSGRTASHCKNTESLERFNVYEWNNLLFSTPVEFKSPINFSNLFLVEKRVDYVLASYRNIMDLFLDVDHIPSVHPGVYDRIGLKNILSVEWDYYDNGSVQTVLNDSGSPGAMWFALFPHTMIEWQPGSLFVTVALPISDSRTSNVCVFKYRHTESTEEQWNLNNDVWETAWSQDKRQAELLTEFGNKNLEQQKIHFRNFLENGIN